jgi:hypothetical protein
LYIYAPADVEDLCGDLSTPSQAVLAASAGPHEKEEEMDGGSDEAEQRGEEEAHREDVGCGQEGVDHVACCALLSEKSQITCNGLNQLGALRRLASGCKPLSHGLEALTSRHKVR